MQAREGGKGRGKTQVRTIGGDNTVTVTESELY